MTYNVINLHFLDACNYKCKHCFGNKFIKQLPLNDIKKTVDNAKRYFTEMNVIGRINLVGGEIFLCTYLQEIIDYIYDSKIKISLVTNGSLLTKNFIQHNKNKIETIGISVDSTKDEINKQIGRKDNKGNILNSNKLIDICKEIKNNKIKLKINTCITALNVNEDFNYFYSQVKPDRLKIFQMKIVPGLNDDCQKIQITEEKFNDFANKHLEYNPVIETAQEMESSYLMINSKGNVLYNVNKPLLGNSIKDELSTILKYINLDQESYNKRYLQ